MVAVREMLQQFAYVLFIIVQILYLLAVTGISSGRRTSFTNSISFSIYWAFVCYYDCTTTIILVALMSWANRISGILVVEMLFIQVLAVAVVLLIVAVVQSSIAALCYTEVASQLKI